VTISWPGRHWSSLPLWGRSVLLLVVLTSAAGAAAIFYRAAVKAPPDPVAQFLSVHWAQPVPPQGDPPPRFTALEASLAPESCAACHPAQFADWNTSLHSRAMGPGIRWQLRVFGQGEANDCLRCHAPLAEQKALAALEYGWANAPTAPMPDYVSADLHLRGNTCASCHVRRHQVFGPPAAHHDPAPHGGFVEQQAFGDSRFCAPCHQFPAGARSLEGKLIENTYEEWRASPSARAGVSCQSCHMPDRRHVWRGIHDPDTVRKGLRRELELKRLDDGRLDIRARITAPGVGHYFPTYVVPKVLISLHLVGAGGERELARQVIGRTVSVDMDKEWSDTRIPPGGNSELALQVAAPPAPYRVEMRLEVAPAEHYARMYRAMLQRNPDMEAATLALLREALRQADAASYRLEAVVVAGPANAGETARAIAN